MLKALYSFTANPKSNTGFMNWYLKCFSMRMMRYDSKIYAISQAVASGESSGASIRTATRLRSVTAILCPAFDSTKSLLYRFSGCYQVRNSDVYQPSGLSRVALSMKTKQVIDIFTSSTDSIRLTRLIRRIRRHCMGRTLVYFHRQG